MIATAIILGYVACSVLAYGITFAYFQRNWPMLADSQRELDRATATTMALFGPIGLIVSFPASGFAKYGMKWR